MKIQCDVCNRDEASVFCSADEAALCDSCDHRIHHANKLSVKHHRFSLLHPSSKDAPRCDVCQERRAFLFCQEDRAILCRECDLPIHTANEHTQKHNRFLLTGVKLSASSTTSFTGGCDASVDSKMKNSQLSLMKKPVSVSPDPFDPPLIEKTTTSKANDIHLVNEGGSTSSISEYLIEMLPGWHVEDFLDSSSAPHGFCKTDDLLPFLDASTLESNLSSFSPEDLGIWVPQVTPTPTPPPHPLHIGGQNGFKETTKVSSKWSHDGFTVPQISSPSSKRSRFFW